MKNFKVVLLFGLGTVLIFVFFMFIYRGGPEGLKTNQLRAEFATIYTAMKMNYAAEGYYFNSIKELQDFAEVHTNFYSFFLTPDEYLLCDDVKIEQVPEKYRNLAFVNFSKFLIVAVQCVEEDESPAVFTMDENNKITQVSNE